MTVTIYGPIATEDGTTWWTDEVVHRAPGDRLIVEQRQRYGVLRADQFDTRQPASIPVDVAHAGDELGEIVYLEREQNLCAVAVVDLEPEEITAFGPVKLSTTTATDRSTGSVQLRSIGIVKSADAAAVGLGSIRWIPGDIRRGALDRIGIGQIPPVLQRAADWCQHRRYGASIQVVERHPIPLVAHADPPAMTRVMAAPAPRSGSGRFVTVDGRRIEIEYSAPFMGVIGVR